MKTSDMIKELCNKKNISVSELARRIGQTPQNFGKKLKRDTVTLEELKQIADVTEVTFEQSFVFPNGEQIKTSNECGEYSGFRWWCLHGLVIKRYSSFVKRRD